MRQGAPKSRTGSPCLGLLALEDMCVDVVVVGGVYHRRHDDIPYLRRLLVEYGSCLVQRTQGRRPLASSRRGSPQSAFSHRNRKYPFPSHKRQTIIFMVGRKKSHNTASTQEMAGDAGRYGRRKVTCYRESLLRSGRGVNALNQ